MAVRIAQALNIKVEELYQINCRRISMKNVVLEEVKKEFIISKEEFKKYFNERKIIFKDEYIEFLKNKNNT